MPSSALLHGFTFIVLLLATVMSFASWILAAIDIRRQIAFSSSYNRIDPAMIVFGVLANAVFLGTMCFGTHAICKAKNVAAAIIPLIAWSFALGVSYCVRRWEAPNNCPNDGNFPDGCRGRTKALIAFSWVCFILSSFYIMLITLLANKHKTLHWTNRQNGWEVPVESLCPAQDPQQIAEEKKNGTAPGATV